MDAKTIGFDGHRNQNQEATVPLCQYFIAACQDYDQNWQLLDDTLYTLCQEHPAHDVMLVINAKVQIVGLSYQTGIQRQVDLGDSRGLQGAAIRRVSEQIFHHLEEMAVIFNELGDIAEPVTPNNLHAVLRLHAKFLQILRQVLRDELSARSFAAKYMHFHCRAVPIFDNGTNQFLPRLCPFKYGEQKELLRQKPEGVDEVYYLFAHRFYRMYQCLEAQCQNQSVKRTDHFINYVRELPAQVDAIHAVREACG
jgi:hypothetical protein